MKRRASAVWFLVTGAAVGFFASASASFGQTDPFGGPGAHFFVAREVPGSTPAQSCLEHYHLLPGTIDSVRESQLVAQVPDQQTGVYPLEPSGPVVGSISVCFTGSVGRDRQALGVFQLASGSDRLTVEVAGNCRDYATPKDTATFFQSCSLQVTGPHTDRVRGGSLTSGGLVPKAMPAASIAPSVWTLFLVKD